MHRPVSCSLLVLAFAALPASAQVAWDAPSLVGPHTPAGLSVLLTNPAPGDGLGVMAHWSREGERLHYGYRAALAQDAADDLAGFAGVDLSGVLASSIEDADIQVLWWTGFGVGVGNDFVASVPVGLVAGWRGLGDGSAFAPYAGGHVVLDLSTADGQDAELNGVIDLGLDLELSSGWVVRFGAAIGDRDAVAVGIRIPGGLSD